MTRADRALATRAMTERASGERGRTPLYHQIETDLRQRIGSGEFATGAALPPEHELTRIYGVSRHTVRTALGRMHADGLIVRGAGRGTFVRPQQDRVRFYLDRSFTQQMAELGLTATSRVLEVEEGTIGVDDPAVFRAEQGARCLRLTRLRLGDTLAVGLQRTIVLTSRCPGLGRYDFSRESLYAVLAREYQLVAKEIHHAVGAAVARTREAKLLRMKPGDPLLLVNTTAFLEDRGILEYTASRYRADRYEYSTSHVFPAPAGDRSPAQTGRV